MLPLSLWFAVAEGAAAALSISVLACTRPSEHSIKLQTYTQDSFEGYRENEGELPDAFDLSAGDDFVDGTPVNEAEFWVEVCLRVSFTFEDTALSSSIQSRRGAIAATLLSATLVILNTASLVSVALEDHLEQKLRVIAAALELLFSLQILKLCSQLIQQDDIDRRWTRIINVWSLTTFATFLHGTRLLLPKDAATTPESGAIQICGIISVVLYAALFILAFLTPRGPELQFAAAGIYSPKSVPPTSLLPVSGYVRDSIYSILLFAYTTPVVMLGSKSDSLEITDLPVIPADMRATALFSQMRRAYRTTKLPSMWTFRPGSGWELLYKLLVVHRGMLTLQLSLALVMAGLYYLPAYFLNQLVSFLELKDAGKTPDPAWG